MQYPACSTLIVAGASLIATLANAGPPLSIDDPGILDPGRFEVIIAGEFEGRDSGDAWLLPVIDVSYGISKNVQVSGVATRAVSEPSGAGEKSDFGPVVFGIKWRFLAREALQMSVAPFVETLARDGAADRGVVEDLDAWNLPVQFEYAFARWRLNAEVAYAAISEEADEWAYGIAGAVPLDERLELLAEVHGGTTRELEDHGMLFRIGVDFAVTHAWHLLASAGSSIHEPGQDDLDWQGYFGLQWFPGD